MNVLLTGSSGYIGENLIDHFTMNGNISSVIIDKKNGIYVENYNNFKDITHIVHLAALPSVKECRDQFEQAVRDNVSATLYLFNKAYEHKIPVVFASSGSAQSPNDNFYALTKRIGELEAIRLNDKGANIKMLRFANIYGGRNYYGNKESVISKFYNDNPLVVNGDGSQTRDFIHISDICRCITLALHNNDIINEPIGVGTGINTSVLDLAKMFGKEYVFNPESNLIGPDESPADISGAEKYLGFKAEIKLQDYIKSISQ